MRAAGGPFLQGRYRIRHVGSCESRGECVRHLVAKRGHEHDVRFRHTARRDYRDRQSLRSPDATPHGHQRHLNWRRRLWQRTRHGIGQAQGVSERREPQIKHAISNKQMYFHGRNGINIVILAD